jgi:hypothetical protein
MKRFVETLLLAIKVLTYEKATTLWILPDSRILGQVILAPPIAVGAGLQCYTRDWAIIEMEASKFDSDNFIGNVIDLDRAYARPIYKEDVPLPYESP